MQTMQLQGVRVAILVTHGFEQVEMTDPRKALEVAEVIENNGPLAVQAILRAIRETEGLNENDAFKIDTQIGIKVFLSDDAKEGPRAFAEKRKPNFQNR